MRANGSEVSEEELATWVRARLRSTKTPEYIEFRAELPYSETGKLLRRVLRTELAARFRREAERWIAEYKVFWHDSLERLAAYVEGEQR